MPEGAFYDLGRDPKKINDVGNEDKIQYPTLNIGPDDFPPMQEMKLGSTGQSLVKWRISRHGGIEVLGMKYLGEAKPDEGKDKKTLLKRNKKNSFSSMSGEMAQPTEGGG